MEMEILVDYSIGAGGSVNVFIKVKIFRLIYLKKMTMIMLISTSFY